VTSLPWRRYSDHFNWSMPSLSVLFFLIIEHSVFMASLFYQKCMLEKVTMQRNQQFSDFCFLPKAIEGDWILRRVALGTRMDWMRNSFLGNTPISREPLIRILRNLARKYFRQQVTGIWKKIENWQGRF